MTDIPEKFQNKDGTVNADAILKSYSELEKKMGAMITVPDENADDGAREKFRRAIGVPADASEYPENPLFDDDSVRARFLDAGLNAKQVQTIYDIANEIFAPAIGDVFQSKYESDAMTELQNFFGGADKMKDTMSAIQTFGEKFLPADTYESLCASPAGIKSIYSMMQSMEPKVATQRGAAETLTDATLRDMMRDPKYWRDHDAEYVRKIESGFKKLYS